MKSRRWQSVICACLIAVCIASGSSSVDVCFAADPQAAAKPVPNAIDFRKREAAQREADLQTFRSAFEPAQLLNVRARLEQAATVSGELAALAERVSAEDLARAGYVLTSRAAIHPRRSHLVRLIAARPWIRNELADDRTTYRLRADTCDLRWPTEPDRPELMRLVNDRDPDVQAMAIEALATLYDPGDALLFAGLLNRSVPTVSVVESQQRMMAVSAIAGIHLPAREGDEPCVQLFWKSMTVADYAQRALRLMTGADLNAESAHAWLNKRGSDRSSLWYWQRRLEREFQQLDLSLMRLAERDSNNWSTERVSRQIDLRKALRAELAALDRLVEAKVILLTNHSYAGGADITEPGQRFFDPPWETRLTKQELFMLLEGEQLWSDVDWSDPFERSRHLLRQATSRIMLNAERSFSREDAPRLQKLFDKPVKEMWWSDHAAWTIGISRLLPVAGPDNLDDPETRDGYLRRAIQGKGDVFTRGYVARELVRVGLPSNVPFLREVFFAEKDGTAIPDLRGSILQALGHRPLTDEKRKFLLELVTDKRSRPILTRPSVRMGDDMHRRYVAQSINAHAGRELVTGFDLQDLRDREKPGDVLDRILDTVKRFDADRDRMRSTTPSP